MAYNLGPASRFDDGVSFSDIAGIFLEQTTKPSDSGGQVANKGSVVLDVSQSLAEIWLKRDNTNPKWDILACRQETPIANGVQFWDSTNMRLNSDGTFTFNTTNKAILIQRVQYNIASGIPSYSEGLTFYDNVNKCLAFFNDEADVTMQVGQEIWIRVYNNTGGIITNGQVCYLSGSFSGFPTVGLALASDPAKCLSTLGFATHDIEQDTYGYITRIGTVRDINTIAYTAGQRLYLSATVAGGYATTPPSIPSYNVMIGNVGVVNATTGTLETHIDIGSNMGDTLKFYSGTFAESFDALVTSNGTTVTMSLEKSGGGDLTMIFSTGAQTLDCTPAQTIVLTNGTDSSPQANYVYIPRSTKILTKSTTQWPAEEHIKVAYLFVPSATEVQGEGGSFVNQNWNDHFVDTNGQGHLTHIGQWIREQPAKWFSGVGPDGDSSTYIYTTGGTTSYFKCTAGVISQMHKHTYSAKDTSAGDDLHVINYHNGTITVPFFEVQNLSTLTRDATGATIQSNRYFNCVFAGVANKGGTYSPILMNLPNGTYTSQTDAEADSAGYDVFTLPRQFVLDSGTGFLIARITFQLSGGRWVHKSYVDLRGTTPSSVTGGIGGGGTTHFSDASFTIFNNVDPTKILDWDLSSITTLNTRTITAPDRDLDLNDPVFNSLHIQSAGAYSGINLGNLTAGSQFYMRRYPGADGNMFFLNEGNGNFEWGTVGTFGEVLFKQGGAYKGKISWDGRWCLGDGNPTAGFGVDIRGSLIINGTAGDNDVQINKNIGGIAYKYDAGSDFHEFDGALRSIGPATFNYAQNDYDFIIYKDLSGTAYIYDAGTDTHTWAGQANFTNNVTISGNLVVQGSTTSIESEQVLVADNHLYINHGYTTAVAQSGGIVVNYLPTATVDTVNGSFTAGVVSTSNPTVVTTGSATFSASDLIQISGANTVDNNGLFEVLSHVGTLLTIRGIGLTSTVEDFTQNDFTTDAVVAGSITKVNVSVLRANTSGVWQYASGGATGLVYTGLAGRESTPTDNGVAFWDSATSKFETSSNVTWNGTLFDITGAIHIYQATGQATIEIESGGSGAGDNADIDLTNGLGTWRIRNNGGNGDFLIYLGGTLAVALGGNLTSGRYIFAEQGSFQINPDNITTRETIINGTTDNVFYLDATNNNITVNGFLDNANFDLALAGDGVLALKEGATPTATSGYGKLWTTSVNSLFFQDGDGVLKNLVGLQRTDITGQASYTLQNSDKGKLVTLSYATAITLTVPSGLESDFWCVIMQKGAGQVTVSASGTTLRNADGFFKTEKQWVKASIEAIDTNDYLIDGRMVA